MMKLRKTLARMIGTAAVAASLFSWAVPMPAAAAGTACPQGWVCVYEHVNFQGRMLKFQYGGDLRPFGFADRTSSIINNTPYYVVLTDSHTFGPDQTWNLSPNASASALGGLN